MNNLINVKDLTMKQLVSLIPQGYSIEWEFLNENGSEKLLRLKWCGGGIFLGVLDKHNDFEECHYWDYYEGGFLRHFMEGFTTRVAGIDFDRDYIVTIDDGVVYMLIPSWNEASNSADFERVATYNGIDFIFDEETHYMVEQNFIKRLLEEFSKRIEWE